VTSVPDDLKNLTIGNAQDALQHRGTHIGADALALVQDLAPGKSLWYARLALGQLVIEQIQNSVDPKAACSADKRSNFKILAIDIVGRPARQAATRSIVPCALEGDSPAGEL
jgi:hypothetical protein